MPVVIAPNAVATCTFPLTNFSLCGDIATSIVINSRHQGEPRCDEHFGLTNAVRITAKLKRRLERGGFVSPGGSIIGVPGSGGGGNGGYGDGNYGDGNYGGPSVGTDTGGGTATTTYGNANFGDGNYGD